MTSPYIFKRQEFFCTSPLFTLGSQKQWLWHDDDNDINNDDDNNDDDDDNIADSGKSVAKIIMIIIFTSWQQFDESLTLEERDNSMLRAARMFDNILCIIQAAYEK